MSGSYDPPEKARRAPMPTQLAPMLATRRDHPFSHPDWLFEIKWDGARALCFFSAGSIDLRSRRLKDLNRSFPDVAGAVPGSLPGVRTAVLDGEIVAFDRGRPSFQRLQRRLQVIDPVKAARLGNTTPVSYVVFDILYLDGFLLIDVPLRLRRELLDRFVRPNQVVKNPRPVPGQGEALYRAATGKQLEGIIGKNANSAYVPGTRSKDWLKFKLERSLDAVVGGYTRPQGSRRYFGALLLGLYSDKGLEYVGHTGTGFNEESLRDVYLRMEPLRTPECPFTEAPHTNAAATWLEPSLVAEITYQEVTADRKLRIPVFRNLRSDKEPSACTMDTEMGPAPRARKSGYLTSGPASGSRAAAGDKQL